MHNSTPPEGNQQASSGQVCNGIAMAYARSMMNLILLVVLMSVQPVIAAVEVERNTMRGSCTLLISSLRTRWSDVRNHMVPMGEEMRNPKSEDFVCLSPYVVRQAMERRIITGGDFRCFSTGAADFGICCDRGLSACTQLNPALFPDLLKKQRKEKPYEPPKSNWVKPPSDGDQWQTN